MLADKIAYYEEQKAMLHNTPVSYKRQFPFLKEVDALALANTQLHLERAYKNFFRRKESGFPKFKSKHRGTKAYTTNVVNGNIKLSGRHLKLPKLTPIRIRIHRDNPDGYILKSVTVSCEASGSYYASLLFQYENQVVEQQGHLEKVVGIDFPIAKKEAGTMGNKSGKLEKCMRRSGIRERISSIS